MNNESTTQKLVGLAEGEDPNKKKSILMRLLSLLFSPGVQNIAAGQDANSVFDRRGAMMTPNQSGGAFDVIYRAKKEREDRMRELMNQ